MIANSYQNSTIAQILQSIIDELTFEGESRSDISDILLSILNQTEYNKETDSVIADLLVRLKAKIEGSSFDPYDGISTGRIADIIISILEETEYTDEPQSRIAELLLELKAKLESYTEVTVSGAIASFITNVVAPLVAGKFYINAVQSGSGDPSPSNVRPISGFTGMNIARTGANVFDKSNLTWNKWYNSDGSLANNARYGVMCKPFRCENTKTIYVNCAIRPNSFAIVYFDKNGDFVSRVFNSTDTHQTSIPPVTAYWAIVEMSCPVSSDITQTYIDNIKMIVSMETEVSAYEPYNGTVYPVSWESEAGTVYGGYLEVDSDGKKTLTATHGLYTFSGGEGWAQQGSLPKYYSQSYLLRNIAKCPENNGVAVTIQTSIGTFDIPYNVLENYDNTINLAADGRLTISANLKQPTNTLKGVQVKYELKTPVVYELPGEVNIDTLIGQNNIWNDTNGDTEVTYLYQGDPPVNTRLMSSSPINDTIQEEELESDTLEIAEKEDLK